VLFGLFIVQFLIPVESVRLLLAWLYVILAGLVWAHSRRQISLGQTLRTLWKKGKSSAAAVESI
jgi:hypothetical protein